MDDIVDIVIGTFKQTVTKHVQRKKTGNWLFKPDPGFWLSHANRCSIRGCILSTLSECRCIHLHRLVVDISSAMDFSLIIRKLAASRLRTRMHRIYHWQNDCRWDLGNMVQVILSHLPFVVGGGGRETDKSISIRRVICFNFQKGYISLLLILKLQRR